MTDMAGKTALITGATGGTGAFIEISSGNNQTGATGTQSDQPIVFVTRGGDLAPIAGVQVVLSVTSGDATIPVTAEGCNVPATDEHSVEIRVVVEQVLSGQRSCRSGGSVVGSDAVLAPIAVRQQFERLAGQEQQPAVLSYWR